MVQSTKASGTTTERKMVSASKYSLMDLFTKATGKITRRTEGVELFIQTRITTLVTGKMTKNMDWESTGAKTVLGTTESGKKIRSTDQARSFD